MPQGEDAVEPDGTDVQAVQQGVPRGDGGPDATPHREVPPRRYLRGAPPRLPVQDMHGAREVGVASRVFLVNWFYRLTGSHLRVVVLCEMVVLTTRTVRVISCLILLLIHKIK